MDSLRLLLEQYARAAWRRRWVGIFITWLICGVGWVGVYLVPNQYESSARLYVDADAILTPLLRGLAADSAPVGQLEMLQRTLLSRPNLEKLISKTDLDLGVAGPSDRERLLQSLANDIKVTPQTRNLFTITYRSASPKLAHDVVQTLLSIFVESATGSNRTDMENAKRFLEHQISSYEQQLRAAEKRRADFRFKYVDILPADLNPDRPYNSATEGARNSLREMDGRLQDALIKRDTLRDELSKAPAMLVAEDNSRIQGQVRTKMQEAQEQLKMLLLRDTEQHPEVIAQKKLIEALRASREGSAPAGGATGKGDGAADGRKALGVQSGLRAAQGALGGGRYRRSLAAAPACRRGRVAGASGQDAARAAGAVGRVPEHGPRLRRAAQELRGTARSPAIGQPGSGGRYAGRQGEAADRRSARDAAVAGCAEPAAAGVRRPARRDWRRHCLHCPAGAARPVVLDGGSAP